MPKSLQLAAALVSTVVVAAGVVVFGWPTFTVMALYWLENVIIGGFTLLRIFAAGARTERYGESLFTGAFFSVHYGLFCLVHGTFVAALFGDFRAAHGLLDPVLLMIGRVGANKLGLLVIGAMTVAAAFDALRAWSEMRVERSSVIREIMGEPYGRIVVLHVALIIGGIAMQSLEAPAVASLLLVAVKLIHDLAVIGGRLPKFATLREAKPAAKRRRPR